VYPARVSAPPPDSIEIAAVAAGRYAIFHAGCECGEERWRLDHADDHLVLTGEQVLEAPHPFPNRQHYRVALTTRYRPLGLEVHWRVGERQLAARHAGEGGRWHARIEHAGQVREQEGDFPDFAEIEFTSPLFQQFILSRRDFQVGGEHEFPVLRIGPPLMAVSPETMLLRCVELGEVSAPWGRVSARRYVVSLPPRPESEGYTFWADEHDRVLETFEGPEPRDTWMKLVEYTAGP
jgi:hypothetical protein